VEPKLLKGSKYYVEVSGIGVARLENRHKVVFDGAYTVELDALSYVSAALADEGQADEGQADALKDLVRAFYAYDKAFNA
jgi:hypothetical protein